MSEMKFAQIHVNGKPMAKMYYLHNGKLLPTVDLRFVSELSALAIRAIALGMATPDDAVLLAQVLDTFVPVVNDGWTARSFLTNETVAVNGRYMSLAGSGVDMDDPVVAAMCNKVKKRVDTREIVEFPQPAK